LLVRSRAGTPDRGRLGFAGGQIIPPRAGMLEVHTTGGVTSSPVDEIGCFAVTPIPPSPFRPRCRVEDGTDVLTGWITL
jgi:hypothetical protein